MELDREALLIYLEDLRTMETILHEDDNKIEAINDKENSLKSQCISLAVKEPQKPVELKPYEKDSDARLIFQIGIFMIFISIIFLVIGICMEGIFGGLFTLTGVIGLLCTFMSLLLSMSKNTESAEAYELKKENMKQT